MKQGNEFLQKRCQKFTYDNAVDGDITTNTSFVLGTLPKGALIIGGAIHIVTDVTDADAGDDTTIAFGYTGATTAFWAATAVSVLETGKLLTILPGQAALGADAAHDTAAEVAELVDASWLLMSTDVQVLATVSNDVAINAGKFNVFIEYYVSV